MAKNATFYKWQWPAGRMPDFRLIVKIVSLKQPSRGLLSFFDTQSYADHLDDPLSIAAEVVDGPRDLVGSTVALRVPRAEARDVRVGRLAGMGIVTSDPSDPKICICLAGLPEGVEAKDHESWLRGMRCGP